MSDEPKLFIDEDWKSQVQREREEARKKAEAAEQPTPAAPEASGAPLAAAASPEEPEGGQLEANFTSLVASLATQAMFALGAIAPPGAKQVMVDLDQAIFLIDTLGVLEEKTAGNLTPEETGHLKEARSELQQIYLARVQQFQEQAMREAGVDMNSLRGPQL